MPASFDLIAETGSTNADCIAGIVAGYPLQEGHWLIADRQRAGRGRQGRAWLDSPGNFMGSTLVALRDDDPPPASLSFVAALAVYEAVLPRLADPRLLVLKWPNDLLLSGAKLSGILLEREGGYAVVGIGVNLAAAPRVDGRTVKAISHFGPAPDRDAFAHDIADAFARELALWRAHGFAPVRERWLAAAHPPGTPLSVHQGDGDRLDGKFVGLEADGALCLRLADGAIRVIRAGDVMLGEG